jgi:hypothetical protein
MLRAELLRVCLLALSSPLCGIAGGASVLAAERAVPQPHERPQHWHRRRQARRQAGRQVACRPLTCSGISTTTAQKV